jgi:cytochrome c
MSRTFLTVILGTVIAAIPATAQKQGDAAKGKEVFEQCAVCHNSTTDEKKMGPSLKGLYKRKLKSGKAVTDSAVTAIVNKGGNGMPAFEEILSAEEKSNLLAFLKSL